MTHIVAGSAGPPFGVLDLETAPDPLAVRIAAGGKEPMGRPGLHRIRAAALLVHGSATARLTTWTEAELAEDEILAGIGGELGTLRRLGGTLLTYGGRHHDLPALRRRAARHWMFDAAGLTRWDEAGWPHVDVLAAWCPPGTQSISLRDLVAGLGMPCDPGPSTRTPQYAVAKATTDVVATAFAHLCLAAIEHGLADPLRDCWPAIATLCERESPALPYLRQFARHEISRALTTGPGPRGAGTR